MLSFYLINVCLRNVTSPNKIMERIKLFNVLETTENFLCVYRNYSSLRRVLKKIALIRVGFVITSYVVVNFEFLRNYCALYHDPFTWCIIYIHGCLSTTAILITITNGIKYSESYKNYSIKMDKIHLYCKDKVLYKKSMIYLFILFLMIIASCIAVYLWAFFNSITLLSELGSRNIFVIFKRIILPSIILWREISFSLEIYIFIIILRIMIICLNVMKINLKTTLKRFEKVEDGLDDITYFELRRDLRKWTATYICIAGSCDDLKKFYGMQVRLYLFMIHMKLVWCDVTFKYSFFFQILLSLSILAFYCIMLFYALAHELALDVSTATLISAFTFTYHKANKWLTTLKFNIVCMA